jgi:GDP-6-deoxy-D-talose 4-dehydrogenase
MRVLVSGSKGFTGRYMKSELENCDHEVIDLKSDLMDMVALSAEIKQSKPEAVVHLAGIAFVGHGKANDFYQVNLLGTRNLLETLYQAVPNIDSVLLASSANVYGNHLEGKLTENMMLHPSNDYAVSKLAMEKMAELWKDRLPIFITRPFNYTGVGQSDQFIIPKIVKHFKNKSLVIELGNLDVYREFNDVRMIAQAYRKLLQISPVGEIINICTEKTYTLSDIISLCEKLTNHTIQVKTNSQFVRRNEVKFLAGNNKKLEKLIGAWNRIELEDTLRWMLNSEEFST